MTLSFCRCQDDEALTFEELSTKCIRICEELNSAISQDLLTLSQAESASALQDMPEELTVELLPLPSSLSPAHRHDPFCVCLAGDGAQRKQHSHDLRERARSRVKITASRGSDNCSRWPTDFWYLCFPMLLALISLEGSPIHHTYSILIR